MFIIMMSDNFLSPRSYQQHRQPCNNKIDIKISLLNLHCMIFVNIFWWKQKSFLYTEQQSKYMYIPSKSNNIDLSLTTKTLYYPSPFYHLSIKWKKKNRQHFIESIHESILLSGKQCTWMKVNDFPASPSNQYSLYKLNAPVERSFGQPYQQIPVAPASDISHLKHSSIIEKPGFSFLKPVIV